ncbi:MAG TPA: nuclear transport factor 2 family protein [Solirubrobacteraceae bacterium]|nr:nuclear transport factor 2 family protein [Solirubrobacteraceae bacterium]
MTVTADVRRSGSAAASTTAASTAAASASAGTTRRKAAAGDRGGAVPYAVLERRPACAPRPASREEIVAGLFAAFGRRELSEAEMLELLHPEIVFTPMTAQVTQAGEPYRGHAGIRRYEADLAERWSELRIELTQIRAAGDAVVALGLVSGRGAAGSFSDQPATWVIKFRDGRVASVQVFADARHVVGALLGERQG